MALKIKWTYLFEADRYFAHTWIIHTQIRIVGYQAIKVTKSKNELKKCTIRPQIQIRCSGSHKRFFWKDEIVHESTITIVQMFSYWTVTFDSIPLSSSMGLNTLSSTSYLGIFFLPKIQRPWQKLFDPEHSIWVIPVPRLINRHWEKRHP